MIIEYVHTSIVKHRWFSGRIVDCHAIDPGSIHGDATYLCALKKSILLSENSREKRARRQNHARRGKCARREKYMIIEYVHTSILKHRWFSGKIFACHAIDPGSIPGRARRKRILLSENSREKRGRRQNHARRGKCARREKYMIIEEVPTSTFKHRRFSGRIVACHALHPVLIDPADSTYYLRIKAFLSPIPTFRDQLSWHGKWAYKQDSKLYQAVNNKVHIICKPAQILILLPAQKKMTETNSRAKKRTQRK